MKKVTLTGMTLLISVILAFAGPCMGNKKPQQGMQMHGGGPEMMLRLLDNEELNLSDDQQAQIREIIEAEQLWRIDHQAEIEKMAVQMRNDRLSADPDLNAMERSIDQISTARAEGMKRRLRVRAQIDDILTDKQREQLQELEKQRHKRMQERPQKERRQDTRSLRPGR